MVLIYLIAICLLIRIFYWINHYPGLLHLLVYAIYDAFLFSSPDSTYDSLDTPLFVAKASDMDLPVRWLAPESLIHHHFLTASDVYSFGMLVYEVLTYGCTPYRNVLKDEEVSNLVSNGDIETRTCDRIFLIKHETSGITHFFIALVISV